MVLLNVTNPAVMAPFLAVLHEVSRLHNAVK